METACTLTIVGRLYPRDVKPVYYRTDRPYRMVFSDELAQGHRKKETAVLIVGLICYLCTHGKRLIIFLFLQAQKLHFGLTENLHTKKMLKFKKDI